MNGDAPELVGLSILAENTSDANLFSYCSNNPTNDKDFFGYISASKIANMFSIIAIFGLFMLDLYANYSKGLVAVGAYVTKIATPIAVKALWWKPLLAAALVVAAVAIVVAAIAIIYASEAKKGKKTKIPSKLKSGNNVKTPKSHKGEFTKNRGGSYTHNKTKWRFENSKDGHYKGEHWHASPPNGKTGDYYNISPDGRILS